MLWEGHSVTCGILAENAWPESNPDKIIRQKYLKNIIQNIWPVLLKMSNQERQRNCSRSLKEVLRNKK